MKYHKPEFQYENIIHPDQSAWSGHRYFAYDLVSEIRPKVIVELGTSLGISFLSFCQAVKDNNFNASLYAVDIRKSDMNCSVYGNEIRDTFQKVKNDHYGELNIETLKNTHDSAASGFRDGSIDLLHIDGEHTFDANIDDFETWFEKVSGEGIVLLHGINKTGNDFGAHKLWVELKSSHHTLEFPHSKGLGVVFLGNSIYQKFSPFQDIYQKYYAALEENDRLYSLYSLKKSEVTELEKQIVEFKLKEINSLNIQFGFLGGPAKMKRLYTDAMLGYQLLKREGLKEFAHRLYWYLRGKRILQEIHDNKNDLEKPKQHNIKTVGSNNKNSNSATVCLIAKNEGSYLIEWMAYYLVLGFDRLLIYDNGSTDNTREIVENAKLNDDRIEYIPWPDVKGYSPQISAYNDVISRTNTEWIAFFDADEFLVLKENDTIGEFLDKFDYSTAAITFNWLIFGSSGHERYKDDLIIRRFTRCSNSKFKFNYYIKTIVRKNAIKYMQIHTPELNYGSYKNASGQPVKLDNYVCTTAISHSVAQINHYVLKSREEFFKKIDKGEACYPPNSNQRFTKFTDGFWDEHDRNENVDFSISKMIRPTINMMNRLKHCRREFENRGS